MDVEVKIEGLRELESRLLEMDALGGQKLLRRVLRKVAKPMWLAAQANALGIGRSRALAASVKIQTRRDAPNIAATVVVTTVARDRTAVYMHNTEYGRKVRGIFYGWMVDRGHRVARSSDRLVRETRALTKQGFDRYERRRVRGAGQRGRIRGARGWSMARPRPWWTPAVNATEHVATSAFVRELQSAMARIERRTSKTPSPDAVIPE